MLGWSGISAELHQSVQLHRPAMEAPAIVSMGGGELAQQAGCRAQCSTPNGGEHFADIAPVHGWKKRCGCKISHQHLLLEHLRNAVGPLLHAQAICLGASLSPLTVTHVMASSTAWCQPNALGQEQHAVVQGFDVLLYGVTIRSRDSWSANE